MSTPKLNIYQRLAKVMEEVTYVRKDKKSGMNYSIVSHDVVTAKVRPALLKHGIIYHPCSMEWSQEGNRTQVRMSVMFVNIDDKDDCFVVPSLGYGIDNQDKGPGKAISYAVKYAILKALALETGDDPDLDQHVTLEPDEALKARINEVIEEVKATDNAADLKPVIEAARQEFKAAAIKYAGSQAITALTLAIKHQQEVTNGTK